MSIGSVGSIRGRFSLPGVAATVLVALRLTRG
jgi:hypothetical protein